VSIRLTCSICKKPDSRLAIIFGDPSEIDGWLPYTCVECSKKGRNAKEELKAKEEVKKVWNFEDSDLYRQIKEDEEKEKLGLIRCGICQKYSPMDEVRNKAGNFLDRLCNECKPKIPKGYKLPDYE